MTTALEVLDDNLDRNQEVVYTNAGFLKEVLEELSDKCAVTIVRDKNRDGTLSYRTLLLFTIDPAEAETT